MGKMEVVVADIGNRFESKLLILWRKIKYSGNWCWEHNLLYDTEYSTTTKNYQIDTLREEIKSEFFEKKEFELWKIVETDTISWYFWAIKIQSVGTRSVNFQRKTNPQIQNLLCRTFLKKKLVEIENYITTRLKY